MISSQNKIIKKLFLITLFALIFILASCDDKRTYPVDADITSSISQQIESTASSNEDVTNKDNEEETTTNNEERTPINVNDNPGDEGYTWTPGEH